MEGTAGSLDKAFEEDESLTYSIHPKGEKGSIPRNYFCSWKIDLDSQKQYWMQVKRQFFPVLEKLTLNIVGEREEREVIDEGLRSTSPTREYEMFLLRDTK